MVCQECSASTRLYTYNLNLPDIQNHLRTDLYLSASQLSDIKEMIRCAEDDLKAYRAEILRLQSKVKLLSTKSDLLKKHTKKLRSLLSPIWTVILLGSSMFPDGFCEADHTRTEVALRRHIQLSGACPLYITIVNSSFEFHPREKKLFQILVRCSDRWQRLSMETPNSVVDTLPDLPILEMLHIHPSSVSPKTVFPNKIQSLRRFSANAFRGDAVTFVPWENITSLKLDCHLGRRVPVDQLNLFDVVERCMNLVTLEYDNIRQFKSTHRDELQPFIVPQISTSVKNLKFSLFGRPDAPGSTAIELLLDSLTLPSLESLSLIGAHFLTMSFDVSNYRLFLDRSACTITSFTLQDFVMPDKELLSLLAVLPALTDLNIHEQSFPRDTCDATITETFFEGLHSYNSSPFQSSAQPLLPRLQRLSIKVNGCWFVETMFVKMIMSRWLPEGPDFNPGMSALGASSDSSPGPQATLIVECLQWVKVHVMGRRVDRAIWKQLDSVETCSGGSGTRLKVLLIDEDPRKTFEDPIVEDYWTITRLIIHVYSLHF
ncbi:hypothetical protein K435DRAFT_833913 [Dendrothele bispora CBS 962.96]|uniref:F-box domain-containing protein n=1 Tax=Dendrothele bispora (strain CBS 962.96) TaxID=1314807 RepID=A0A4S8MV94_DENBC|nr:hypothetical protein K435DRAFT_833913 [Dendrothele bispora CBS 962.96]